MIVAAAGLSHVGGILADYIITEMAAMGGQKIKAGGYHVVHNQCYKELYRQHKGAIRERYNQSQPRARQLKLQWNDGNKLHHYNLTRKVGEYPTQIQVRAAI